MIDWKRVSELRKEVGDDEFRPILDLFMDEVELVMQRLPVDGPGELEADLQFLKGNAWSVGLRGLGEACEAAEEMAREGWQGHPAISSLQAVYHASKQRLTHGLMKVSAGAESMIGSA